MNILVREYMSTDAADMTRIWNDIVRAGIAFPQDVELTVAEGDNFFRSQSFTGTAYDELDGQITGGYILHPNNVGRCGHICNASYAVDKKYRGMGVGEKLVKHCIVQAANLGFRILQFNAVVKSNVPALHLYHKLGFIQLGVIPGGFRMPDGSFADIIPHYIVLDKEK